MLAPQGRCECPCDEIKPVLVPKRAQGVGDPTRPWFFIWGQSLVDWNPVEA